MRLILITLFVFALSFGAFAQDHDIAKKATPEDNAAVFDSEGKIKRGAPLGDSETVSLKDVMQNPEKYSGKSVIVNGFIVRSCQKQGCWAELAPSMDSKTSIRVDFNNHKFFIPLKSQGFKARIEGVFSVKVLSKEEVEHYKGEGASFENVNEDGSASVISFHASGAVLTKAE
ncbi:MAG: DUF4920 domain-containing protein [Acidobacteria bacterium]|nr:MAG: DUF4920 domain-containing protein [Acidobacteriota bacterium]REK02630.1 MAG: DUF4920 domain-containing protein [Acidobacteriota bacterium]REK13566.1 MAG: DUF4920 domain-containing protein [Acidobacteriota bacterium]REK41560.1 MAG: DUF4920 domain-containing protein [Acidobacteriota bacterium]